MELFSQPLVCTIQVAQARFDQTMKLSQFLLREAGVGSGTVNAKTGNTLTKPTRRNRLQK
jgi:hypothetical protein